MNTQQLIPTLASFPFTLACVSLVRKFFPSIDGVKLTLGLALVFAAAAQLLGYYLPRIPEGVLAGICSVMVAITTVGGTAFVDRVAAKFAGRPWVEEAPTTKETPTAKG